MTVVSSLSPGAPSRRRLLEGIEPHAAQAAAHAIGLVGGLATVLLAFGVLRGRRRSGRAAVAVLGVLAVVQIAKGLEYEEALLGLGVAAGLQRVLASGRGEAEPSPALIGGLVTLVALGGAFVVAMVSVPVAGTAPHLLGALVSAGATVAGAVPTVQVSGAAHTGLRLLLAIGAGSLVLLSRSLLAPARTYAGHAVREHRRAAALVAAYGDDSIAPFALRADKTFHFACGGALAYRTLRGTAVVAGDPVGPDGSAGPIMASFMDHAARQGWDVVLLGAAEDHLADYRALGMHTMEVGLEAVVDPRRFSLDAPALKTVRKAVRRVQRHGWTVETVTGAQLEPAAITELTRVETEWRRRHRRLYGFAWAHDRLWGAPEDTDDLYAIARDPAGEARAFQRYVRYRRGFSLDAMRRLDDEPNGIADSLVAAVLIHARDHGCSEVSLNFSSFAHLTAADTLPRRTDRIARWVLRRLHGHFQLERLARFAQKFGPQWRPRYLVYSARSRLPAVAVRILQAEAYIPTTPPAPTQDAWVPSPIPVGASALAATRR